MITSEFHRATPSSNVSSLWSLSADTLKDIAIRSGAPIQLMMTCKAICNSLGKTFHKAVYEGYGYDRRSEIISGFRDRQFYFPKESLFCQINEIRLNLWLLPQRLPNSWTNIPKYKNLHSVVLGGLNSSDNEQNRLLDNVLNIESLREIELNGQTLTDLLEQKFWGKAQHLRKIKLFEMKLNYNGLLNLLTFSQLSRLDIQRAENLTDDKLGIVLRAAPQLTDLVITECREIDGSSLGSISSKQLTSLHIESEEGILYEKIGGFRRDYSPQDFCSKSMKSLFEKNPELNKLMLVGLYFKSSHQDRSDQSSACSMERLKELVLQEVDMKQMTPLIKDLFDLQNLQIFTCINCDSNSLIFSNPMPHLKEVRIEISDSPANSVLSILENCPNLEDLTLLGSKIPFVNWNAIDFIKLVKLHLASIKKNSIDLFFRKKHLALIGQTSINLKYLKIRAHFEDEHPFAFKSKLICLECLELHLHGNNLSDRDLHILTKRSKKLRKIKICNLDQISCNSATQLILECPSLMSLTYERCSIITLYAQTALNYLDEKKRAIFKLKIRDCHQGCWLRIASKIHFFDERGILDYRYADSDS